LHGVGSKLLMGKEEKFVGLGGCFICGQNRRRLKQQQAKGLPPLTIRGEKVLGENLRGG